MNLHIMPRVNVDDRTISPEQFSVRASIVRVLQHRYLDTSDNNVGAALNGKLSALRRSTGISHDKKMNKQ